VVADSGRATVTGAREALGAFKTPSLRNVERTAPYMHDGSLATLEEVVEFYSDGGISNPYLDPDIRPLRLSAGERRALLAFLRSFTGGATTPSSSNLPDRGFTDGRRVSRGVFGRPGPTLRELARTAPYMHDGSLATLEDVVDYYDRGGNANLGAYPLQETPWAGRSLR
jgi:cytochrome c peroxidase